MNFISKLERKFGKYAINNLTLYLMIAYAIGYVISIINEDLYYMLQLNPALVMKGQVWRLFTWVCTNPQGFGPFIIFMFMLYYWIGNTLERHWGTFKYNLYMFSGYFFMTLGAMLIYIITSAMDFMEYPINMPVSTYYINLASFLAFATLFPNVQLMLYFIIPIKIKWLAIVDAIFIGIELVNNLKWTLCEEAVILTSHPSLGGLVIPEGTEYADTFIQLVRSHHWAMIFSIVMALLNFLVFFLLTRNYRRLSPAEIKRKREFKKAVNPRMGITKHKCAICGRSEEDDPSLSFRFCSKCEGNYEYCQDHLFTHEHVGLK